MSVIKTGDMITVLTCRDLNAAAAKKFIANPAGQVEKVSFSAGMHFEHESLPVKNLHELAGLLANLQHEHKKFVIRGQLLEGAGSIVFRRLKGDGAAFVACPRPWVCLDVDKLPIPGHLDPAVDPEGVVRWVVSTIPAIFQDVECVYKFSSSQNVPKNLGDEPAKFVSLHLWFWCDRPVSEQEWKQYFGEFVAPVDKALFSAVQIHYTANPVFNGMADPLPNRFGMITGQKPCVQVPVMVEKVKRITDHPDIVVSETTEDNIQTAIDLLSRYYKEGQRDRLAGAIAGALYRGGWEPEQVGEFVLKLASSCNDIEADERYAGALRICDAIDNDQPAQGIPVLRDELGIENIDDILKLLGLGKPDISAMINRLTNASPPQELEKIIRLLVYVPFTEQSLYMTDIQAKTQLRKSDLNKLLRHFKDLRRMSSSQDRAVWMVEKLLRDKYQNGRHIIRSADERFYHYRNTHWERMPEDLLRKELLPYASSDADDERRHVSALLNEAINILRGRVFVEGDPLRLQETPPTVINCLNGEVWISEEAEVIFKPHRPESYLRNCLPVVYDPSAKCPQYERAALEIFGKGSNPREMYRHFNELTGYICQPWRKHAVIVLLLGGGSNGKTSQMGIVEKLLGSNSVMSDRIGEMERNPFKLAGLVGKLLFVDDDVDAGTCLPDGFLKKISEEKTITAQEKYGPTFQFKCRAVPVLLSNIPPTLKDLSNGIRRRIMVIPFNRTFDKTEMIPGLFDEIWNNESSGILNVAIDGFRGLRRRGRFLEPEDCLTAKEAWLIKSNVLTTFIREVCITGPYKQRLSEFYSEFQVYCREAGVTNVPTKGGVRQRLETLDFQFHDEGGCVWVRGISAVNDIGVSAEIDHASELETEKLMELLEK